MGAPSGPAGGGSDDAGPLLDVGVAAAVQGHQVEEEVGAGLVAVAGRSPRPLALDPAQFGFRGSVGVGRARAAVQLRCNMPDAVVSGGWLVASLLRCLVRLPNL